MISRKRYTHVLAGWICAFLVCMSHHVSFFFSMADGVSSLRVTRGGVQALGYDSRLNQVLVRQRTPEYYPPHPWLLGLWLRPSLLLLLESGVISCQTLSAYIGTTIHYSSRGATLLIVLCRGGRRAISASKRCKHTYNYHSIVLPRSSTDSTHHPAPTTSGGEESFLITIPETSTWLGGRYLHRSS